MINDGGDKYLEVRRLIELLSTLDPGYRVHPNRVGNLAITDADDNYVGFVDFIVEGEIEIYKP